MSKMNPGKVFENAIKNSINQSHVLVKRLNDNAASFCQNANTRFTSTNECDYILFEDETRTLYGLELKTTLSSLTFWRKDFEIQGKKSTFQIKKNQILGLKKFNEHIGVFGFIINFRSTPENRTFFVGIEDFLQYTKTLEKKSINMEDILKMNPIEIENKIMKTNYKYDMEKFFHDTAIARKKND